MKKFLRACLVAVGLMTYVTFLLAAVAVPIAVVIVLAHFVLKFW